MRTALWAIGIGFVVSTAIFTMTAVFGIWHRSAKSRRYLWRAALLICITLCVYAVLKLEAFDANSYWSPQNAANHSVTTGIQNGLKSGDAVHNATANQATGDIGRITGAQELLLIIYFAGFALLLTRTVVRTVSAESYAFFSEEITNTRIVHRFRTRLQKVCRGELVTLKWSVNEVSPAQVGIFRNTIVLPRSAQDWSNSELDIVLLHELSHARNRDNAWQFLVSVFHAFQWFNPLMSIVVRRSKLLSEMAVDEDVLEELSNPVEYAETLVSLARRYRNKPEVKTVFAASSDLERRIGNILTFGRMKARSSLLVLLLASASSAVAGTVMVNNLKPVSEQIGLWPVQQIRWESSQENNAVFLHGDISILPDGSSIGHEGLILALRKTSAASGAEVCATWRGANLNQVFSCDISGEPQLWLAERLTEAAHAWPPAENSPLKNLRTKKKFPDVSGSWITGLTGRSTNPNMNIQQSGWIDGNGARVGVFRRERQFDFVFRYDVADRTLVVLQSANDGTVSALSEGVWWPASDSDSAWFRQTLLVADRR